MGNVVLKPEIEKNLLINQGYLKLKLIFNDPCPSSCSAARSKISREVIVPVQSVHKIDNLCPDDHVQEKVKVKAISVRGVPDSANCQKWNIIIKVILEVKLVISREELVSVPIIGDHEKKCKKHHCGYDNYLEPEAMTEFENFLEFLGETKN
ncbi:hypothetical protein N752_09815 [Desulforamulus aquiferis]|nr:hypothetical protein [Desulforamulus aquiferis]RYD05332.1 hypothetical protein N752_09815 [Desulforamulus aquiferis]